MEYKFNMYLMSTPQEPSTGLDVRICSDSGKQNQWYRGAQIDNVPEQSMEMSKKGQVCM